MTWYVTNRDLLAAIELLTQKVDALMSEQSEIDAAAQQIEADVAAENTALASLQKAIADLEAQVGAGQPADLTALKAAVADLDTATAAEAAAVPNPLP